MRADRLVSMLMLLQTHGRVSARELSERLEVSVRTIYRDMEALSAAGIPVYAERGASGGCCLVENYRTNLTGMSADEAHALMLLESPSPLDSLEVGQKLKAALYKLYAALPRAPQVQPRVHMDWAWWGHAGAPSDATLEQLYRTVTQCHSLRVRYRLINGAEAENIVEPLGLVAKGGAWYLVWQINAKRRYFPVAELLGIEPQAEHFSYPADFDLGAYWQEVCAGAEADAVAYAVRVRAQPEAIPFVLRRTATAQIGWPMPGEAQELELAYSSFEEARSRLLALGGAVEVLYPPELRDSLRDFAEQICKLYSGQFPVAGS